MKKKGEAVYKQRDEIMYYGLLYDTDTVKNEVFILTSTRILRFKGGAEEVTDLMRKGKLHIGSEVMVDEETASK